MGKFTQSVVQGRVGDIQREAAELAEREALQTYSENQQEAPPTGSSIINRLRQLPSESVGSSPSDQAAPSGQQTPVLEEEVQTQPIVGIDPDLQRPDALSEQQIPTLEEEVQRQPIAGIDLDLQRPDALSEQQTPTLEEEVQRQSIPGITPELRRPEAPLQERYVPFVEAPIAPTSYANGGFEERAIAVAVAAEQGNLFPSVSLSNNPVYKETKDVDQAIVAEKEGSLIAAVQRSNAVIQNEGGKQVPNKLYSSIAAAVTEDSFAKAFAGDTVADDVPLKSFDDVDSVSGEFEARPVESKRVTKATANAQLGQRIHLEYQRADGVKVPDKLPHKEAETLGDAYKEMWAAQHPSFVTRLRAEDQQVEFQLTVAGMDALRESEVARKKLFSTIKVRPSKIPLPQGKLPGDVGKNLAKSSSGKVGDQKFDQVIQQAAKNLATIPNVVDKRRAKLLYSTALLVLGNTVDNTSWQADINHMGNAKIQKYTAGKKAQDRRRQKAFDKGKEFSEKTAYDPEKELQKTTSNVAQALHSIALERKGANYLSYGVTGFNGRVTPQQSFFDPTNDKSTRFVTRNAVPSKAVFGSRVDNNLRQMYASSLVKGADTLLPDARETALVGATEELAARGKRLSEALTMTDGEFEAVSDAITQNIPVNDPSFPTFGQLTLDPEIDAELIADIQNKGEDGLAYMDGLIDFYDYYTAKKAGKNSYHSYFNAYIDGKTNGLAANGMQMGHVPTAFATGVIRSGSKNLLDDGDVRDQLEAIAVESVLADGFEGDWKGLEASINDVATEVYSFRQLNKDTTMTFGYGKELESFEADFDETIGLILEREGVDSKFADDLNALTAGGHSYESLSKVLLKKYIPALTQVVSDDAISARSLNRSAAIIHSAMNESFVIKSPTGSDLAFGNDVPTGERTETEYGINVDGKRKSRVASHYESEATASAAKSRTDEDGVVSLTPGEVAYGGVVPGPVQATDAATVALTATGDSWKKLKVRSDGNPYIHTIYDAFKMDAAGYDTVLEEVNSNWLKVNMEWSYLEQIRDATAVSVKAFSDKHAGRRPDSSLTQNERSYMDWFLKLNLNSQGQLVMGNALNRGKKAFDADKQKTYHFVEELKKKMKAVGYDVNDAPSEPNFQQLEMFVNVVISNFQLGKRLDATISKTNAAKKVLAQKILQQGHKLKNGKSIPLQYYAH